MDNKIRLEVLKGGEVQRRLVCLALMPMVGYRLDGRREVFTGPAQ